MAKSKEMRLEQKPKETALNIRNFPNELLWACHERAAKNRMRLREFVIQVLKRATEESER